MKFRRSKITVANTVDISAAIAEREASRPSPVGRNRPTRHTVQHAVVLHSCKHRQMHEIPCDGEQPEVIWAHIYILEAQPCQACIDAAVLEVVANARDIVYEEFGIPVSPSPLLSPPGLSIAKRVEKEWITPACILHPNRYNEDSRPPTTTTYEQLGGTHDASRAENLGGEGPADR